MAIESYPLSVLTVRDTRVLVPTPAREWLFGRHVDVLEGAGEDLLVDAIATTAPGQAWGARLNAMRVEVFDVNRAPLTDLRAVPTLGADLAEELVAARPYFSLEALLAEHQTRQPPVAALRYLGHEGYEFIDIPRVRRVALTPSGTGLVAMHPPGGEDALEAELLDVGLTVLGRDRSARVLAATWRVPPEGRPARLRELKRSSSAVTVAPFLRDAQDQTRVPHPFRLDVALQPESGAAAWARLLVRFPLTPSARYSDHYRSFGVRAHAHDLGALYRTLRALTLDHSVRYAEPTWLPFRTN